MTKVLTGTSEWQVDEWSASYYPDDLPEEWRLSYFANEYSTALIPCCGSNDQQQKDILEETLPDCPESFRPVVSINVKEAAPGEVTAFFDWYKTTEDELGNNRFSGVLLQWGDKRLGKHELEEWRAVIPDSLPVALEMTQDLPEDSLPWLSDRHISAIWSVDTAASMKIPCWLAKIELGADSRQVASETGQFLKQLPDVETACIIAISGYEDVEKVHELVTLVRLLHG